MLAELGRRVLPRLRVGRSPRPAPYPLGQVMDEFARTHPRAVFVQVGAHDTTQLDPLARHVHERQWSGLMIEPVPYVFDRLCEAHGANPRVALENVAVADRAGTRTLYYLPQSDDEGLPPWYDALASFREDVLLGHTDYIPDVAERVATMDVPCATFEELCERHRLGKIDVIQIDTEGYDHEVLRGIDFARHHPGLVMFEHLHLDGDTRAASVDLLRREGYETVSDHMDTMGLHRSEVAAAGRRLRQRWARLRAEASPARP